MNIIAIISFLLLAYYVWFLIRIINGLSKLSNIYHSSSNIEFVSVIVPFRNEEKNITALVESLKSQVYEKDKFEVLFVDDNSNDNSFPILNELIKNIPNFYPHKIEKREKKHARKKDAIAYGVSLSKGDIIVTTDADCIHPQNWLKNLIAFFSDEVGFVSGPVEFKDKPGLFGKLQRLEFAGLVITGAGLIGCRTPIICNGANIAYRKSLFNQLGGFDDNKNISSGDDEFLMQKIFSESEYDVVFAADKECMVQTESNDSIKDLFMQRQRWASKGFYYKDKKILLKLIFLFLFYLSLIGQLFLGIFYAQEFLILVLSSITIKAIVEWMVLKRGRKLLFNSLPFRLLPLAEIFQVPYIIMAAVLGTIGGYKWKDREVVR